MTFVLTDSLEVDAKLSHISLTDDRFIQYYTIDLNANNSSTEAVNAGESKVSPKKRRRTRQWGTPKKMANPPPMARTRVCVLKVEASTPL